MIQKFKPFIFILLIWNISCTSNDTPVTSGTDNATGKLPQTTALSTPADSTEQAKKWLKEAIVSHFSNDVGDMKKICTAEYSEYKQDATNVDLDPGMPEAAFKKKWQDRFGLKYAGIGVGFLISGQDYGKISVAKCEFKSRTEGQGFLFETQIEDKAFNASYKRDIKVIPSGNSFLIADVLEYD